MVVVHNKDHPGNLQTIILMHDKNTLGDKKASQTFFGNTSVQQNNNSFLDFQ